MGRQPLPIPARFYELAAAGHHATSIARELGATWATARRWAQRAGVQLAHGQTGHIPSGEYAKLVALNEGLLLQDKNSKSYRYHQQKKAAAKRGVGWEISFVEWVSVWNESGKWDLRGNTRGRYCMARTGDEGPYKVGNVRIALFEENAREGAAVLRSKGLLRASRGSAESALGL